MQQEKRCPICKSINIGEGIMKDYTKVYPVHKMLSLGSNISVELCTDCGHILSLKVTNPEKFK